MNQEKKSAIDVARQALKQLAMDHVAPTPDNFRRVYVQIAGEDSAEQTDESLLKVLDRVLREAGQTRHDYAQLARDIKIAFDDNDWAKVEFQFRRLVRETTHEPTTIQNLHEPNELWRDLLIQVIELGLLTQVQHVPELERKAKLLLEKTKTCHSVEDIRKLKKAFESYLLKLQNNASAHHVLHQELLGLFKLLIENMSHLALGDDWMHGQIDIVKSMVNQPLSKDMLDEVKGNLSALLFRQKLLKNSLLDAKESLKKMAVKCLDLLKVMSGDAGEHHQKIVSYQEQINQTQDVAALNVILDNLKQDMASMETSTMQSYQQIKEAHEKIKLADALVEKLAMQLDMASQAALQDHLTGALNKRGMEDAVLREFARADSKNQALCMALLDVDNFKLINDTLGYITGDEAIKHLANIITQNLRNDDVLVRYGGESFLILLPSITIEAAEAILQKVQRELTKQLFLYETNQHLITFSAGVTLREPSEIFDVVMQRAENALYEAKNTGRNKVVRMAA